LADRKTNLKRIIEGFKTIGLDTQPFIYHFQENPVFLPLTEMIFQAVEKGEVRASTSTITLMEVLVKPKREGNAKAFEEYKFLLQTFPNLTLRHLDEEVAEKAAEIRAQYNIRPPDAIQLASAFAENAEAFVTNDERLRRFSEIEILILNDYR
jgi:predicted nucleic acid-binding protein